MVAPQASSGNKLAASAVKFLSETFIRPLVALSSAPEKALVIAMTTGALSFVSSLLWYYSRTVIEIKDSERSMWIQTWMDRECSTSIQKLRKLVLARSNSSDFDRPNRRRERMPSASKDSYVEREGGRFSPPKLSFEPTKGLSCWAWYGWWPISICISKGPETKGDPWSGFHKEVSTFLTIWFAPKGIEVARALLLRGRELYLTKRAKQTEIWMGQINSFGLGRGGRNAFSVVRRPSRPLSTVIMEGQIKQNLRDDAIQFLNAERWYVEKGIPYRRGFLLYGPPGCGKTSLVTALAGDLRLPIVLISLGNKDMTDSNLIQFLSEIPRDSIVLLEDIDCAIRTNRNNDSGAQTNTRNVNEKDSSKIAVPVATPNRADRMTPSKVPEDGVTLSGLLNAIDGVGAQEGRILFMTTNNIEDLDEALIRPGRVDARFHVGKATKAGAGQLFDQFFRSNGEINSDSDAEEAQSGSEPANSLQGNTDSELESARAGFLEQIHDGVHSFAELQGVLMKARDDPTMVGAAMTELLASSSL